MAESKSKNEHLRLLSPETSVDYIRAQLTTMLQHSSTPASTSTGVSLADPTQLILDFIKNVFSSLYADNPNAFSNFLNRTFPKIFTAQVLQASSTAALAAKLQPATRNLIGQGIFGLLILKKAFVEELTTTQMKKRLADSRKNQASLVGEVEGGLTGVITNYCNTVFPPTDKKSFIDELHARIELHEAIGVNPGTDFTMDPPLQKSAGSATQRAFADPGVRQNFADATGVRISFSSGSSSTSVSTPHETKVAASPVNRERSSSRLEGLVGSLSNSLSNLFSPKSSSETPSASKGLSSSLPSVTEG